MSHFDCQACGACCCNTERNRRFGHRAYIEVTARDLVTLEQSPGASQLTTMGSDGKRHMILVGEEQRCVALSGTLLDDVSCTVYRHRPESCRTVEAGDEECLRARRFWQLPLTAKGEQDRLEG